MHPINTYIINRFARTDRRKNILNEFGNREEFELIIIEAIEEENGAFGLWKTLRKIIEQAYQDSGNDFTIICEDDHCFTKNYNMELLQKNIEDSKKLGADILLGGVSWFKNALRINKYLFWTEKFTGLQFTVVFKKFYNIFLSAPYDNLERAIDLKLSAMTQNIFLIHPFISIQKEFGYSDVTLENNVQGHVEQLFIKGERSLKYIDDVHSYLNKLGNAIEDSILESLLQVSIPTYVINANFMDGPSLTEHVEFKRKPEFVCKSICTNNIKNKNRSMWKSLKHVISSAERADEDVIILVKHNHIFPTTYSWSFLLKNIIEANKQGADCLLGGVSNWENIIPASSYRFWVRKFSLCPFFVIFKSAFNKILTEDCPLKTEFDVFISDILTNKMLIYPFVSYSNQSSEDLNKFIISEKRLKSMQERYVNYKDLN